MADDLSSGRGLALIDPHGDLSESIAATVSKNRKDALYFDSLDSEFAIGFNPRAKAPIEQRAKATRAIVADFKIFWPDSWRREWRRANHSGNSRVVEKQTQRIFN